MIDLDGTKNKSRLGANSILGVSLACARQPMQRNDHCIGISEVFSHTREGYVLPIPLLNIINGGGHADNNLDIQELLVVPAKMRRFSERVRAGFEIFHALKELLLQDGRDTGVGDEGGFAPNFRSSEEAIEFVMRAIIAAGYTPGKNVFLGTDIGASELFQRKTKKYRFLADKKSFGNVGMIKRVADWVERYPFLVVEDPLDQDEWAAWSTLTEKIADRVVLVGDDLFVTHTQRLAQGIALNAANSILIKPNQVGTLTETLECILLAKTSV